MSALAATFRSAPNAASRLMPRVAVAAAVLLVAMSAAVSAQTATQVVRFRVFAQRRAEAAPVTRPLSTRSARSSAASSAITFSTNDANLKVTASIDRVMPAGTSLSLAVASGASANGTHVRRLGTEATDVLTDVMPADSARIPVAYRISAENNDAAYEGEQRVVTYTIIGAP